MSFLPLDIQQGFLDRHSEIEQHRCKLPHWNQAKRFQFVTFRLADSLPQSVIRNYRLHKEAWLKTHPRPWSQYDLEEFSKLFSGKLDQYCDAGYGDCILKSPAVADALERIFKKYNNDCYTLIRYVIMPNHIHILIQVNEKWNISQIVRRWKGESTTIINRLTQRTGSVWMREYYDRIIRNESHFDNVMAYIRANHNHGGIRYFSI